MKKMLSLLLAVVLCLCLSACGGGTEKPSSGSAPSSSSTSSQPGNKPEDPSSPESSSPDEDPEPDPEPSLQPGRILAMGNERLSFSGDTAKGTQAELERWQTAVRDPDIVRLDFNNMHQEEQELPAEQEQMILAALRNAELRLYDDLPNPSTGGACRVIAYDGEESTLFQVNFMGDWFQVQFDDQGVWYVFDGEGTTLNDLFGIN